MSKPKGEPLKKPFRESDVCIDMPVIKELSLTRNHRGETLSIRWRRGVCEAPTKVPYEKRLFETMSSSPRRSKPGHENISQVRPSQLISSVHQLVPRL